MAIRALIAILSYAIALCGIIPLFPWLTLAPRLILVAAMAAGVWQERRGAWPLKNWALNAATVPVFLFYAAQVSRSNPVQPLVSGLAIMLAVRLLGEKSGRHHLQIHALALFCLAASSLFDLSPIFLVYLSLLLVLVAVALVLLCFHSHDRQIVLARTDLRRVLGAGLLLPLASLPLLLFFFPLLPRTPLPLWNFQTQPAARSTGFTDKVAPGDSPAIEESRQLTFRAELPRQAQTQLYWRGTVFNRIEGNRWRREAEVPEERILYGPRRLPQVIYPEPGLATFLLALDAPATINAARAKRSPDGLFEQRVKPGGRRQHYAADSVVAGRLKVDGAIDRDFYLQLPAGIPAPIQALADGLRQRAASDSQLLELLEAHFQKGGYRYTMQGLPTGGRALEQFLFESKQGNCEFFASAFGLLARAAGLPSRLVGGYLGGEYNELGGYYLIREQLAHVWVEVFINDQGWLRVDPSSFAKNAASLWGQEPHRSLLLQLRLALDALDHAWNRSVITYDFERQAEAARTVGKRLQALRPEAVLKLLLRPALLLAGGTTIVVLMVKRRRLWLSPEERVLRRFYRRLERECRIEVQRGRQGLFELAAMTGNQQVLEFVEIYAAAVYHDRALTKLELSRLREILAGGFGSSQLDNGS